MKKVSAFLAIISLAVFFIYSCQKDKSDTTYPGGSSNNFKTTVTGIVLDESNAPLNGVTVTAYGQTTTTNQYGTFVLKNLNAIKDRCVLQFTKAGFFNRAHGLIASENTVNYVRIVLLSNAATQSFSASAGGIISLPDGSSAEFQPNSIVTSAGSAYTGTVNLIVKHLSPDDANFGFTIPGGDLAAVNANNKDVVLYTYGMLGVELTGNSGEALQLAAGTSATLTMAIAASQLSSAPATIPLWYFDETASLWKEEGAANKVGNNYVGTVAHFSWWNCDVGTYSPLIKGKVIDCNGIPIPNCVVTVNVWATTLTNQNGEWQGQVPAGMPLTMQVLVINNPWLIQNSVIVNIPALSNNQTYIVPDLVLSCPTRIIGTIKSCTGETTNGLVSISNASNLFFQYTLDGTFNLLLPENTQMVLYAANTSGDSYSQNITTPPAPNILNAGNIFLCDSAAISGNYLILNGGPFVNQAFNFNIYSSSAMVSSLNGWINCHFQGNDLPDCLSIDCSILYILDTIPGLTTVSDVAIELHTTSSIFTVVAYDISCNLISVGQVGDKIKGYYSGNAVLGPVYDTLTIYGTFDLIRTQ